MQDFMTENQKNIYNLFAFAIVYFEYVFLLKFNIFFYFSKYFKTFNVWLLIVLVQIIQFDLRVKKKMGV